MTTNTTPWLRLSQDNCWAEISESENSETPVWLCNAYVASEFDWVFHPGRQMRLAISDSPMRGARRFEVQQAAAADVYVKIDGIWWSLKQPLSDFLIGGWEIPIADIDHPNVSINLYARIEVP